MKMHNRIHVFLYSHMKYLFHSNYNYNSVEILTICVYLFFSVLNRVLEPTISMEMKLSNGKIHMFEVNICCVLEVIN